MSEFLEFVTSLKDPLLVFMGFALIALIWTFLSERKERREVQKQKDELSEDLVDLGKDTVKLATIWEEKAKEIHKTLEGKDDKTNKQYAKIIQLLGEIKGSIKS